ncbi:acyl-CoA N-acyltransferase [Aspergillus transmontanensis]|uniref:Acyl-CoA N-acyltransferase n=1 Tax=Aspergillus transmontanensis TaxID=1034304 RepID=A0A5N6W4T1_9EURO|nr:acyl-CoA N-acyltransferase [Aspergillus transmontanensis]
MTTWKIEPCFVGDAAALARNNMAAFWEDPNWVILWPKDMKQEFIIEQSAKRQPRNLLHDREKVRHQKAVYPSTGAVVGYARWILPPEHCTGENGSPAWAEAQVPDVSEDEKKRYQELAESAWWSPREDMNSLDDKNHVVMDRIRAEKPYIKLDYLAVHPENKGKGIGTALVASGIEYAERVGVPIFTMAFKAGRGIYARLGFQEVDRVIQDDSMYGGPGEYAAYFMIYDVQRNV